jgi:hypothetical protein
MKTTKLQNLARFTFRLVELNKIARTVRRINTNACNYSISKGSETRRDNLEARADQIAREFKLRIYCQRDPRGASLYLVDKNCGDNYSSGIALGC